ncbi:MAG: hypothetical protein GY757_58060, partial [bacterium]|nr:hypothetical protein [bacterium]
FGIFSSLSTVINIALSGAIYLSLTGSLIIVLWGMKQDYGRREWGCKLFRYLTVFCAGVVVVTLVGWGLYEFAGHLSQVLALIIILALVVLMVYIFRALMREAAPLIGRMLEFTGISRSRRLAGFGADEWKEELGGLEPNYQATLLRRTSTESMGLKINDFLLLLQEVEGVIKKEPALSVYWAKRSQVEHIIRQEKTG